MRTKINRLAILFLAIPLSGCGSWFHPYHETYLCPDGFPGKCTSVEQAYEESFRPESENFSPLVKDKKKDCKDCGDDESTALPNEQYNYKNELYKELAGIIRNPETPVLKPATQRRVLIPGYTDEGQSIYYGYRYVYFMDTEPQWMLPTLKDRARVE